MKKHIIHALRTHAKRTLAAAFAAAFALGSALTLSACSGKPAKQTSIFKTRFFRLGNARKFTPALSTIKLQKGSEDYGMD